MAGAAAVVCTMLVRTADRRCGCYEFIGDQRPVGGASSAFGPERMLAGPRALVRRLYSLSRAIAERPNPETPVPAPSSECTCVDPIEQGARVRVATLCHAEPAAGRAVELLDVALHSDECGMGGGSASRPLKSWELSAYLRAEADRVDVQDLVLRVSDENAVLARACELWAPDVAATWMASANAHLGGARPIDVVKLHDAQAVFAALEAEQGGAFA